MFPSRWMDSKPYRDYISCLSVIRCIFAYSIYYRTNILQEMVEIWPIDVPRRHNEYFLRWMELQCVKIMTHSVIRCNLRISKITVFFFLQGIVEIQLVVADSRCRTGVKNVPQKKWIELQPYLRDNSSYHSEIRRIFAYSKNYRIFFSPKADYCGWQI